MPKCKLCNKTGSLIVPRSTFTSDGYRISKCPICEGEKYTHRQASSEWLREQKRIRRLFGLSPQ